MSRPPVGRRLGPINWVGQEIVFSKSVPPAFRKGMWEIPWSRRWPCIIRTSCKYHGARPRILCFMHPLCLYKVYLSSLRHASSVSSAASIRLRCGLLFYSSNRFAQVPSQQPKLAQTTPTTLLLHMHLSRVECIISPTRGLRLVAGPSHHQLSKAPLPV